jgi:hypothetical protein
MSSSTEELYLPESPGGSRDPESRDRYARLLQEAARHIDELERGLLSLARLPVHAHTARLALLHELLGRCGRGISAELKVAAALRDAGLRQIGAPAIAAHPTD